MSKLYKDSWFLQILSLQNGVILICITLDLQVQLEGVC